MATLAESVANWMGRVELLARGADEERRGALRALERGDPLEARERAHALLDKVPGSPVGLAILVDACEALWLYDEAASALRQLCASAPWRGELWVRLADNLQRLGEPASEVGSILQHALEPEVEVAARRSALLSLTDIDLSTGDPWRAGRWLDALRIYADAPDVALRRLELALYAADGAAVANALETVGEPEPLDGRATLACGRGRWMLADPTAIDLLLRAFILDALGVNEVLASYLARSQDVVEVARIRAVLAGAGRVEEPSFALALALAEGRTDDAKRALEVIARTGNPPAARALLDIALEREDWDALRVAIEALGDDAPSQGRILVEAMAASRADNGVRALELLDGVDGSAAPAAKMAAALRLRIVSTWLDHDERFRDLLTELRRASAAFDRLDLASVCEALAIEQDRPLRVAVVGEFNAGKSTFVNALLGADVAPTGILPTTASLHWLSWAPDPFARIVTIDGPDRIVSHTGLKGALQELRDESRAIREVHIYTPIERLRRIEVLDTPGFNAPDADHLAAASRAVREAHVALWILDGTQALKDSERRVLARIADVGTPVLVLVNKCDRLDETQAQRVVEHVTDGLREVGLRSMGPVVGFSARLALAGRLGDADAERASSWSLVESALSRGIVDCSDELRAAAVRRKAHDVAVTLEGLARERQLKEERETAVGPVESDTAEKAARLLALDRTACERILAKLESARRLVLEDLRPLRVASVHADDPHATAYAEARVLARMVEPLTRGLADEVRAGPALEAQIRESVVMVLRGACASARDLDGLVEPVSWRVVRASGAACHDRLAATREHRSGPGTEGVRRARMTAIRCALSRGLPSRSVSGTVTT